MCDVLDRSTENNIVVTFTSGQELEAVGRRNRFGGSDVGGGGGGSVAAAV